MSFSDEIGCHGDRRYDFTSVNARLGHAIRRKLAFAWAKEALRTSHMSLMKAAWVIKLTLEHIARQASETPSSPAGKLATQLRKDILKPNDAILIRTGFSEIANRINDLSDTSVIPTTSRKYRLGTISNLNRALRILSRHTDFPSVERITCRLKATPFDPKIPSLGEIKSTRSSNSERYSNSPQLDAHADHTEELSNIRLNRLRELLCAEFDIEYQKFRLGQGWIDSASYPSIDTVEEVLNSPSTPRCAHTQNATPNFKRRFIDHLRNSLGLESDDDVKAVCIRQFAAFGAGSGWVHWQLPAPYRLLSMIFGSDEIQRHLEATPLALNAAFGVLLIDTGFNVSSLEDLPAEPFIGTSRHGKIRISTITAMKIRARGSAVDASLINESPAISGKEFDCSIRDRASPTDVSSVTIIKRYLEMTKLMRTSAPVEIQRKLWIRRAGINRHGENFQIILALWQLAGGHPSCGEFRTTQL